MAALGELGVSRCLRGERERGGEREGGQKISLFLNGEAADALPCAGSWLCRQRSRREACS